MDIKLFAGGLAKVAKFDPRVVRLLAPFTELSDAAEDALGATSVLFTMSPKLFTGLETMRTALRENPAGLGVVSIDIDATTCMRVAVATTYNRDLEPLGMGGFGDIAYFAEKAGVNRDDEILAVPAHLQFFLRVSAEDVALIVREGWSGKAFEGKAVMAYNDIERAIHEAIQMNEAKVEEAVKRCFINDDKPSTGPTGKLRAPRP